MNEKKYYVTTPIYYASGTLTLGHCYTTVIADACARFKRMQGYDVMFLTGSDEHGLKIARNAEKENLTPIEFTNKVVLEFKDLWKTLNISYDKFIRTTDEEHIKAAQYAFNKLYEKGLIYKSAYEGLYCVPCETFFTESQLVDGNCPDCGRPVEKASEESYFLKMSAFTDYIKDFYAKHPNFLVPESRKNEIYKNFIENGLNDLCVSRTTFDWGIPVPFDKKHVMYVWIDALINYISAIGYPDTNCEMFKKYWPADVQFVGRDISRFHCTIWPVLLHALDLPLPKTIHSHGFLTQKGDKISKSKGNGFNPKVLSDRYTADAVRYYLLKEGPIYNDCPYTTELFLNTYNSELVNGLGNLVSRTTAMILQNFNGELKAPDVLNDDDKELINTINALRKKVEVSMETCRVDIALKDIYEVIKACNKYIDITTPWILAKTDKVRLATVLYNLFEGIRVCATLLQAFIPDTANKVFDKLGVTSENLKSYDNALYMDSNAKVVVNKGEALFNRIDVKKEMELIDGGLVENNNEKQQPKQEKEVKQNVEVKNESKPLISIEEFDKAELKIGLVLESVEVEGSDKLLKNTIKIGDEVRTIVSGIKKFYKPGELVGKKVLVVTNLKPIKLKGILSSGMVLCAVEGDSKLSVLTLDKDVECGSEVC